MSVIVNINAVGSDRVERIVLFEGDVNVTAQGGCGTLAPHENGVISLIVPARFTRSREVHGEWTVDFELSVLCDMDGKLILDGRDSVIKRDGVVDVGVAVIMIHQHQYRRVGLCFLVRSMLDSSCKRCFGKYEACRHGHSDQRITRTTQVADELMAICSRGVGGW